MAHYARRLIPRDVGCSLPFYHGVSDKPDRRRSRLGASANASMPARLHVSLRVDRLEDRVDTALCVPLTNEVLELAGRRGG